MRERYVVIGNPIAHSRSPQIHAMFAQATGQELAYDAVLAPLDGFAATLARLVAEGVRGSNVTLPFKTEAFRASDAPSERARLAGAANTLTFHDGKIAADNTDGIGLVRDLTINLGVTLAGKRVLLLGAGGAARGVIDSLLQTEPAELVIANRSAGKAEALADQFGGRLRARSIAALADGAFDVLINATSAGLQDAAPELPGGCIAPGAFAYDMVYGKGETPFMKRARAQGAQAGDGLGMLVEQAAESFRIWRAVAPQTAPVIAALRRQLPAA
ncbi:MAG TPA: shikimate dehydrogenase [Usitatibacteraceae bacterium]|nr:shikimate dehydrogenase [Usitatibacteraceae bacterium]